MSAGASVTKKDFFISYNKADQQWAEWIAWQLEEAGYTVVIQAWDFGPSSNFVLEMDRATKECSRVLAVLSPDYVTSLFTSPEWANYFAQDPTSEKRLIVSVRVRQVELTGLLARIVYADLFGKEEADVKRDLLDSVKLGRRKPETAPPLPGKQKRTVASKPRLPGVLPEIWYLPYLRNPNFTEPGNRVSELRDALRSGKPAALTQALIGVAGVGKTQLAIEYAYRYASDYAIVWFLPSEQSEILASKYAALAQKLGLRDNDAEKQSVAIDEVREALQRRNDWLLIFDNAQKREELNDYLPSVGGHVIITSRNPGWGAVAQKLAIEKWPPAVALEFLIKRTTLNDHATLTEIALELDHVPLALEQAAAEIENGTTPEAYLATLQLPDVAIRAREYGLVMLPLGHVSEAKAAFERALRIDRKRFGNEHWDVSTDIKYLGRALWKSGDLAGAKDAFERALQIAEKVLPPEDPELASYLNELAYVLFDLKEFADANTAVGRAVEVAEKTLGHEHRQTATCISNRGDVRQALGDLSGAKADYERALRILQTALGDEHPNTVTVRKKLGGP